MKDILIVEDEEAFAQIVAGYLDMLGYSVTGVADSGEGAMKLVTECRPNLALLDIQIRGAMDGFQVAEKLRREFDIPSIFLTSLSDDDTLQLVQESSAYGYLLKPFRTEELKAAIELALIRYAQETRWRRVEQSFSAAIHSTSDGVILTDADGCVSFMNPSAERLTGWISRLATGEKLAEVLHVADGEASLQKLWRAAAAGEPVREEIQIGRRGFTSNVEVTLSRVQDMAHGPQGMVLVLRDNTERARIQAELRQSQVELRFLTAHLQTSREEERASIAREVHDELGQVLTALKYDVSWLDKRVAETNVDQRAAMQEKLKSMSELVHRTVQTVRRISTELRPGVLDDLGLEAAADWLVREFQKHSGLEVTAEITLGEQPVPPTIATMFFRTLQESLTNVSRHANATHATVKLTRADGMLLLVVEDDGRGISQKDLSRLGGFGLIGIRERVASLQGTFEVGTRPGKGTVVSVSVPETAEEK